MHILLIEDNENISSGLEYSLKNENYSVTICRGVKEALIYLLEDKKIDIAIIDISLPDGNGFDLYENSM